MPVEVGGGGVVERGACQLAVVDEEPGGLDQVDRDPKAGPEPEKGAGVLRNVGLIEG